MADLSDTLQRVIRRQWVVTGSWAARPKGELSPAVTTCLRATQPLGIRSQDMVNDLQNVVDALPDLLSAYREQRSLFAALQRTLDGIKRLEIEGLGDAQAEAVVKLWFGYEPVPEGTFSGEDHGEE